MTFLFGPSKGLSNNTKEVKNLRKAFDVGIRNFYFGVGARELYLLGGGGRILLVRGHVKLHNTSIKSIFGITNLIYFRDI